MTSSWPVAPSRQRPAPRPVGSRSTIGMVNARDKRGGIEARRGTRSQLPRGAPRAIRRDPDLGMARALLSAVAT